MPPKVHFNDDIIVHNLPKSHKEELKNPSSFIQDVPIGTPKSEEPKSVWWYPWVLLIILLILSALLVWLLMKNRL